MASHTLCTILLVIFSGSVTRLGVGDGDGGRVDQGRKGA
jgi:hypothetical protein